MNLFEAGSQQAADEQYESLADEVLPLRFGSLLTVPRLTWENFPGPANEAMKWSAHVYWNIEYHVVRTGKKPSVSVGVHILPKSWVKHHKKCAHLLNHEQGHFLIGNLCALEFVRRVHTHHSVSAEHFDEYCEQVFMRTFKQYLDMERQYDDETEHRLNYKKQLEWDGHLRDKLLYYHKIFDGRKNKFLSLKKATN